jgi:hypothetical protein
MTRGWRRPGTAFLLLAALALLGGCQIVYLLFGQGTQPAQYQFGKGQRVLVLVDVSGGVSLPPAFATTLADRIGLDLLQNKAVSVPLVPQERLIKIQQTDPGYAGFTVVDIAAKTDADQVLQVAITQMAAIKTADGTVAEGRAVAYVKVCNRQGRVWPGDSMGQLVEASVSAGLLRDKSNEEILKQMAGQLTLLVGRMFHSYELENREIPQ